MKQTLQQQKNLIDTKNTLSCQYYITSDNHVEILKKNVWIVIMLAWEGQIFFLFLFLRPTKVRVLKVCALVSQGCVVKCVCSTYATKNIFAKVSSVSST